MRMDLRDRAWNHSRGHHHVTVLNVGILSACAATYAVARFAKTIDAVGPVLRFYLSDVLAGASLLAFANLLTLRSPFANVFARPPMALLLMAGAIAEWELLAPLYTASTPDVLDVFAYLLGAAIYLLVIRAAANCAFQRTRT